MFKLSFILGFIVSISFAAYITSNIKNLFNLSIFQVKSAEEFYNEFFDVLPLLTSIHFCASYVASIIIGKKGMSFSNDETKLIQFKTILGTLAITFASLSFNPFLFIGGIFVLNYKKEEIVDKEEDYKE